MSQITTLTNHRSPQNQPHYFIRTHHLNRRPLCWSHQNKGSNNQDCHKRFYRHMFFWFIYFFTFETSATASCGYTGICVSSLDDNRFTWEFVVQIIDTRVTVFFRQVTYTSFNEEYMIFLMTESTKSSNLPYPPGNKRISPNGNNMEK